MMWYNEHKDNLPQNVVDSAKYALDLIKEKGLEVELIDRGVLISRVIKEQNKKE